MQGIYYLLHKLSCFNRQEQCNTLADLLREYQILRTSISSISEGAGPLSDISSVLKDHEETRRSLAKVKSNYVIFHALHYFSVITVLITF